MVSRRRLRLWSSGGGPGLLLVLPVLRADDLLVRPRLLQRLRARHLLLRLLDLRVVQPLLLFRFSSVSSSTASSPSRVFFRVSRVTWIME
jgi:hypothetical protein